MPVSRDTGITIDEPDESFLYIEPEVGNTFKSAIIQQIGSGASKRSEVCETLPLQFNNDSKDFSYKSLSHPRIAISQNLGHGKGKVKSFKQMSRESAFELNGALELLEDS
ncbi:hypothetical protein E4U61_000531 [Claviceps capensis]|nr:hypothetical protein E4U61_000531 [Claviceps capensis]